MDGLELQLIVERFDVDNEQHVVALNEVFDATAAEVCGSVIVNVNAPLTPDRMDSAKETIVNLERVLGLRVIDLDLDLVDEGEIAARTGLSRQAVNHYATGKRGEGFPSPHTLIGGRRIWTWASVNRWLVEHNPDAADPVDHLCRVEQRHLAGWIAERSNTHSRNALYVAPFSDQFHGHQAFQSGQLFLIASSCR